MDTTVTVSAPQDLTVLMTGARAEPSAPQDGRRTWTSTSWSPGTSGSRPARSRPRRRPPLTGSAVTVGVLPDGELSPDQLVEWTDGRDHRPRRARRRLPVPRR